jgi:hypothetical protein
VTKLSTIFLDECGYTGQNLLDTEQPVFTLASLCLSESDCHDLKVNFFSNVQSEELKYTSLSRRPRQQEMILKFLRELSTKPNLVKFTLAHKQFVLITKMVEMLVEPACYEDGIDLYDKGANISLSNLLFYALPTFGDKAFFDTLLKHFQDMMRSRTKEAYDTFFEFIFRNNYSEDLDELLNFFRISHVKIGRNLLESKDHLDISVSLTLTLMSLWRQDVEEDIVLIHDASSAMAKEKQIWEMIVDPDLSPITVGYDRRTVQFPIGLTKTCSEDSKKWAGLQLADILAGSFTRCIRWMNEGRDVKDKFGKELMDVMGEAFTCFPIAPEMKVAPDELETTGANRPSPHDYLTSLFMQNPSVLQ